MTIDPIRLAEAAVQATLMLASTALPTAWRMLDGPLAAVLAGMLIILTAGAYAVHAVTFDCLRLTGQRTRGGRDRASRFTRG